MPSCAWRKNSRGKGVAQPVGGLWRNQLVPTDSALAPHRSASLAQVNAMLREQLDQASLANQTLSEDIRKVTSDWTRSCKELEQREAAWRREEEVSECW